MSQSNLLIEISRTDESTYDFPALRSCDNRLAMSNGTNELNKRKLKLNPIYSVKNLPVVTEAYLSNRQPSNLGTSLNCGIIHDSEYKLKFEIKKNFNVKPIRLVDLKIISQSTQRVFNR